MGNCPLILAPEILRDCNSANGYPMGLPMDPVGAGAPLGLESTKAAVSSSPIMVAYEESWDAVENFYVGLYGTTKKIIGQVYSDVRSGAGTVYDDVSKPVSSALTGTYWYLILGVVVVAGGLYFVGKGGAVKVSI